MSMELDGGHIYVIDASLLKTHQINRLQPTVETGNIQIHKTFTVETECDPVVKHHSSTNIIPPYLKDGKFVVSVLKPNLNSNHAISLLTPGNFVKPSTSTVKSSPNFYLKQVEIDDPASTPSHLPMTKNNTNSEIINYVDDSYLLCSDQGVNDFSEYANEKYMLIPDSKPKLKNKNPPQKAKVIPPKEFKKQLMDTSDIVTPMTLLPSTKTCVEISTWDFNKYLNVPQRRLCCKLRQLYERNCITGSEENEFDVNELNLMPEGYKPEIDLSRVKRITRKRKNPSYYVSQTGDTSARTVNVSDIKIDNVYSILGNNVECNEADNPPEYVETFFADEEDSTSGSRFFFEADIQDTEEIIVIHGDDTGESIAYTQENLDALLAAAAKNNSKIASARSIIQEEIIIPNDS